MTPGHPTRDEWQADQRALDAVPEGGSATGGHPPFPSVRDKDAMAKVEGMLEANGLTGRVVPLTTQLLGIMEQDDPDATELPPSKWRVAQLAIIYMLREQKVWQASQKRKGHPDRELALAMMEGLLAKNPKLKVNSAAEKVAASLASKGDAPHPGTISKWHREAKKQLNAS